MRFLSKRIAIILFFALVFTFITIYVIQYFKSEEANLPTITQNSASNTISNLLILYRRQFI